MKLIWHRGAADEALAICERLRVASPDPQVGIAMAQILVAIGRAQEADRLLGELAEAGSADAMALQVTLALMLGNYRDAVSRADSLLAVVPGHLSTLVNKQAALLQLSRFQEALVSAHRALQIAPGQLEFLQNRVAALLGLERNAEALAAAESALALHPCTPGLQVNLAGALLALGRHEEGLLAAETVSCSCPDDPLALASRISALLSLGRFSDALAAAESAVERFPTDLQLALLRLAALRGCGEWRQAIGLVLAAADGESAAGDHLDALLGDSAPDELLDALAAPGPEDSRFHSLVNLALRRLLDRKRFPELLRLAERFLPAFPDDAELRGMWAIACASVGRLTEADQFFEALSRDEAVRIFLLLEPGTDPASILQSDERLFDPWELFVEEEMRRFSECDFSDRQARVQRIVDLVELRLANGEMSPLAPFESLHLPIGLPLRLAIARSYSAHTERVAERLRAGRVLPPRGDAGETIRIGYISADYRDHPTSHLIRTMFGHHDRREFEVYAYSLRPDDGSEYRQTIAAQCDSFLEVSGWAEWDIACRIAADGIQILVDLNGYTQYTRPRVFAFRPAPVQIQWLGFPGSTGAEFIDYIIVDRAVLPAEELPYFSEAPVYLPGSYQVNDGQQPIATEGIDRTLAGLPEEGVVFAALNRTRKIEPELFDLWMRILAQVPGSVLWLLEGAAAMKGNLSDRAAALGVDPSRLVFAPFLPKAKHLERLALADLFLDTFTYNAHTAASDALWAGVPVLTCIGEGFPARVGASLVRAAGLPELVASDGPEYLKLAVALSSDRVRLASMKQQLRESRGLLPLFDTAVFVAALEDGYRQVWELHSVGEGPCSIDAKVSAKTPTV